MIQELRHTLRALSRSPGFSLACVLTLALGIGANTAIFSLVHGVLLEPLPYVDDDELVVLRQATPGAGVDRAPFSVAEFFDLRERARGFEGLVEYHGMTFTLLGREEPERVSTGVVSHDFFDLLGVVPVHGRGFQAADEEEGAEAVLLLSHDYWQRSFGAAPEVVGQVFQMNDRPHTVIGVLPPIPEFPDEHDVYMPSVACPFRAAGERRSVEDRGAFRALTVLARLDRTAGLEAAERELDALATSFAQEHPATYLPELRHELGAVPLKEELVRQARPTLWILLGTAILVLLLACTNVANLVVARRLRRERELAVRASLGAGRLALVRQAALEGVLLGVAGAGLGLLVAWLGLDLLKTFVARFTPRAVEVAIDPTVLGFTFALALLVGLAAGALPALGGRANLVGALREGGQSTIGGARLRLRSLLLAAQVAVAVVLLIAAGLLLRSFYHLTQVDPGFDPERVLTAEVSLNWSKYTTPEDWRGFYDRLLDRLDAHPGVVEAAAGDFVPLSSSAPMSADFLIEGVAREEGRPAPRLDLRTVTPGYFRVLAVPLVEGRGFDQRDHADSQPVAVINQSLARRHFADRDPIGRRISLDDGASWLTVVGVVGDVRPYGLDREAGDELYRPLAQGGWVGRVLVRTAAEPRAMARELKEAIWAIDPEQPVSGIETLEEVRRSSVASPRLVASLLSLFAVLALLITASGVGSVVAYSVSQRTQEIGIRMALGAEAARVRWMVLRQGLLVVGMGLVVGLVGAVAFGRLLDASLFRVSARDPLTWLVVGGVLLGTTLVACWLPARRATRIDPTVALRAD